MNKNLINLTRFGFSVILLLVIGNLQLFAQISIVPSYNSVCTGSNNVSISPIIIRETNVGDFAPTPSLSTFNISLSGSNFNLSGGNIAYSSTATSDITVANLSLVGNSIQITLSVVGISTLDNVTISGLQVSVATGTGTNGIFAGAGGTATINGEFVNYGTISGITTPHSGSLVPISQICTSGGGSTNLTLNGVTGASSYSWGIVSGSGTLSGGGSNNQSFMYSGAGYTTITVAGLNGSCVGPSFSQTVTVLSIPNYGGITPSNYNQCPNSSMVLTITGVSNATNYLWNGPSNTTVTSFGGATATVNFSTGNFTITTVGVNETCIGNSPTLTTINVNPIPSPPTSAIPNSRCGTGSVTIGVSGGASSNYNWYNSSTGGTLVGSSGNLFNTPSISTTTNYYAASYDWLGCESTRLKVTASVTGNLTPPSVVSVSKCITQALSPISASGSNLKWYSDPALSNLITSNVSTYLPPAANFTVAGVYNFYVTQTFGGCESGPAVASLTINDTTQIAIQGLGSTICNNSTSTYTLTGFPGGGYFPGSPYNNFVYTTTLPGSIALINPQAIPFSLNTLTVSYFYVNSSGCLSKSISLVQKVAPNPPPASSFSPSSASPIIQGNYSVNLSAPTLTNAIFLGPNNLVSNNQLVPSAIGTYQLTVTGFDNNGCLTSGNVSYTIIGQPNDLFNVQTSLTTVSVMGTNYCQGTPPFDFLVWLSNPTISVPDQNSTYTSAPSTIAPTTVVGGVPTPLTPDVSAYSYYSYSGFSGNPLVTTNGLTTIGGVTFMTATGLANISGERYAVGKFNANQAVVAPITFNYQENVPNYQWQPDPITKFGVTIGYSQTSGHFQYTGTSVNVKQFTSQPINVGSNAVPSFNLPSPGAGTCINGQSFSINPSSNGLKFSWSSNSGLGLNQPAGLITTNSGFLFNPSASGIKSGVYSITATGVQLSGCSNYSIQSVKIVDTTSVAFLTNGGNQFSLGIPSSYCKDNRLYALTGYVTVPGGTFNGPFSFYGQGVDVVGGTVSYNYVKSGANYIGIQYTNTITGCTTNQRIGINIDSSAYLKLPIIPPSCAANPILLQGTVGGVSAGFLNAAHFWTGPGTGTFTPSTVSGGIVRAYYIPSGTDTTSNLAAVTLETAPTGNSCPSIQSTTSINLNSNVQIYTNPSVSVCASDPIILTSTLLGSAIGGVWNVATPNIFSKTNVSLLDAVTLYTIPVQTLNGTQINGITLTASPPSTSACSSKVAKVSVNIDQLPYVTLSYKLVNGQNASGNGLIANSCSLNPVSISGLVTGGKLDGLGGTESTTGTWISAGSGTFASTGTTTSRHLNDIYIPSSSDTASSQIKLYFISDINSLSACKPAIDSIRIQFYRPLRAKATVLNPNICGGPLNNIQLRGFISGGGVTGTVNSINSSVFNQWQKIQDPGVSPQNDIQFLSGKTSINTDYKPTNLEDSLGASLRFQMWTYPSAYCPSDTDIVTTYISQPAGIIINKNTNKDTSYCADPNGIVKLKAQVFGSTPYAVWSAPNSRLITPSLIITSVVGIYSLNFSTYTPAPSELSNQTKISFALTSGKPTISPLNSPPGTPNTCPIVSDTLKVTINTLPRVSISGLQSQYCNYAGQQYQLIPNPPLNTPGKLSANWTNTSLGINQGSNYFNPLTAINSSYGTISGSSLSYYSTISGSRLIPIGYEYRDYNGCYNDTVLFTVINPLPQVDFSLSTICSGADTVSLYGQKNPNGGISSFVLNTNTINGVALVDSITTWKWSSSPIQVLTAHRRDSLPTGKVYVSDPGAQNITLTVKSLQGCTNSITKSQIFYPYPKVDFTFKNQCFNDTTIFTDFSTTNSNIYSIGTWQWDFGDGFVTSTGSGNLISTSNTFGTYTSPGHIYTSPGNYNVRLTLTTAQSNCTSSNALPFYILPKIKPTASSPYIQNFTTTNSGFVATGDSSSWQFGVPSKTYTNLVGTGQMAWYTGKDSSYNQNENSWVECPCFDMTSLTKPIVSIDFKSLTDNVDGAVLLYSPSNSSNWKQLGTDPTYGLNWYNSSNLSSSTPGDKAGLPSKGVIYPGWSGFIDTLSWRTARYSLDSIVGNPSVRFRIAFGSTKSNKPKKFEGFAFKNFTVKEKSKVVLLEHFTNSSKPATGSPDIVTGVDNNTVNAINVINKKNLAVNVLPIFYHTNFPGKDTLNSLNQSDPSSRSFFYGISSIPRSVLDGNFFNGASFTQPNGWTIANVVQRSLVDPPFAINFNVTTTSGDVTATAVITALTTLPSAHYSVQMSVIENVLSVPGIVGGNGQRNFYYVQRKLLPDANGTTYTKSWAVNESVSLTQNWTYSSSDKPFNPAQVGVVAFIQNNQTKEVFQVGYLVPGLAANVTALEDEGIVNSLDEVNLYPNPANDEVILQFESALNGSRRWVIYDALGVQVLTGNIENGYGKSVINTNQLSSGWYLLVLQPSNGSKAITKKLVIQH